MTNNFLINKNILQKIKFDERLKDYGHEDTFFGYQLKKAGIEIKHIDNPVLNAGIERNEIYLNKSEQAAKNLSKILEFADNDTQLVNEVTLLKFHDDLKKKKLLVPVSALFTISAPLIKFLLKKGYFTLPIFDFYKLGIFAKEENKRLSSKKL